MQAVFIRLENTFEEAMEYRNSPNMQFYIFEGVQLIKMAAPYVQRTYTRQGIELENFVVTVWNTCGDNLGELPTDTIQIVRNFQDANGIPQVEWAINTDNQDFGQQLIYLDFLQGANEHIYSTPFYWTDYNSQFTSRWDYKAKASETMLSTQLRLWYFQPKELEEIEIYDPVGGGRAIVGGKLIEYEVWRFDISDIYLFRWFKRMRRNAYVYCNFFKVTPFDAFDTPDLLGKENYAEADVNLVFDYTNNYDPFYLPPVPPVPPVVIMTLTLTVASSFKSDYVNYYPIATGFTPDNLAYQYSNSPDGPWITSEIAPYDTTSLVEIIDPFSNNWYYRVLDPVTGIYSNVVQIPLPAMILDDVVRTGGSSVRNFIIYYNNQNFVITNENALYFQYSTDGSYWLNGIIITQNTGNRVATINTDFVPNFFRIYNQYYNIYSNVYTYS